MNEGDHRRAERIFAAALEIPDVAERRAYVERTCAGDERLRGEVESLLAANEQAGTFLQQPPTALGNPDAISAAAPLAERSGDRIGRYKLLEKIGEGGFGDVWMAEQEEPVRRRVALKILKAGMDTRSVIGRFEAERQALALMDHPNIAKVFDAGASAAGRPYFAMEMVRGIRIVDFCDANQLSTEDRLRLFIQVCQAAQHAHQKGIIHRDLKPSNILVTLHDGVPVPKVIDFGIAKATQQPLTDKTVFTQFQQFLGTPAYMSPEQAELSGLDIDTRSDIYSLGVLLYELLTGATPFDAKTLLAAGLEEMRRIIREQEPPRPSTRLSTLKQEALISLAKLRRAEPPKLLRLVRGDLDWIVMRCLEKDRSRRYETANGLASDIQRYLHQEPISARPPSAVYRFQKLVKRNKLAFAAGAMVFAAVLTGAVVSTWQAVRATRASQMTTRALQKEADSRQLAEQERQRAEENELRSRQFLYGSDMNLAQHAVAANNLGRAQRLLERHRPKPGQPDLRNWEWRYLWQQYQSDALFVLARQPSLIRRVSFSSDGKLLVAGGEYGGPAKVWDVARRQVLSEIPDTAEIEGAIAFSHEEVLAFRRREGPTNIHVVLWDVKTRSELGRLPQPWNGAGHPGVEVIRFLAFSQDGRLLAVRLLDGSISIWDVQRKMLLVGLDTGLRIGGSFCGVVTFSPDAKLIAAGGRGGQVKVFDWAQKTEKINLTAGTELILALAISPDGKWLASGTGWNAAPVKLWNFETGEWIADLDGHRAAIYSVAFSPDGGRLVSASADQTIRLWEVNSRQEIAKLRGHQHEVFTVAFSPDGKVLASGGKDGSIQFWDPAPKSSPAPFTLLSEFTARGFSFDAEGKNLVVANRDGWVRSFDVASGKQRTNFLGSTQGAVDLGFSANGLLLVAVAEPRAARECTIQVRDPKHYGRLTSFVGGFSALRKDRILLEGGKALATFSRQSNAVVVKVWDQRSWQQTHSIQLPREVADAAICLADNRIVYGDYSGFVQVLEVPTAKVQASFRAHIGICSGTAVSPDGSLIATCSENGEAKLWDARTLQERAVLRGHVLGVYAVAFSPDGRRLATGSSGKEAVKLWDVTTGQELATLPGTDAFSERVMFSPDGRAFAALDYHGKVHLWRAPTWSEIEAAERANRANGASTDTSLPTFGHPLPSSE